MPGATLVLAVLLAALPGDIYGSRTEHGEAPPHRFVSRISIGIQHQNDIQLMCDLQRDFDEDADDAEVTAEPRTISVESGGTRFPVHARVAPETGQLNAAPDKPSLNNIIAASVASSTQQRPIPIRTLTGAQGDALMGPAGHSKITDYADLTINDVRAAKNRLDLFLSDGQLIELIRLTADDWYTNRVQDIYCLRARGVAEQKITSHLHERLRHLRLRYAQYARTASITFLPVVAERYVALLGSLQAISSAACREFLTDGELASVVQTLPLSSVQHMNLQRFQTARLSTGLSGKQYPEPRGTATPSDYAFLATAMKRRGWNDQDVRRFAEGGASSPLNDDQLCTAVQQWFSGQLLLSAEELRARLLGDSLNPVLSK